MKPTNINTKQTLSGRMDRLENLAFGWVNDDGKAVEGFVSRLVRLENLAKAILILSVIPALHFLGAPTEQVSAVVKFLFSLFLH